VLLASLWWLDAHHDQPPTQTQLADHVGIDSMMTSQVTRKLQARELLDRTQDANDARARRIRITDNGRRLAAAAITDVETVDHEYFSSIDDDRDRFLNALHALATGSGSKAA
jgi:DNA-binding MarR family transcriptional regulator